MNNTMLALFVGLLAGAGGAFLVDQLDAGGTGSSRALVAEDLAPIEERLMAIEQGLREVRNPPATLTTRDPNVAATGAGVLPGGEAAVEALLARIDDRVGKSVKANMELLAAESKDEESSSERPARKKKKRVPLAEAAREMELTRQQEDELLRIYQDSQNRLFKLLAEPGEDPEQVKTEILEALKQPGGRMKVMGKYMPRAMKNLGGIMSAVGEREAAIVETLGAEKAEQLKRDFTIEEDDILGMGGGGMTFEARSGR